MNKEEWETFWASLVGDHYMTERMGSNRFDSVGEFLEWQRREWIKLHDTLDFSGFVRKGNEIISQFNKKGE